MNELRSSAEPCPVCASASRHERTLQDVRLYRCSACDHCFTDVSALEYHEDYSPAYYEEKHRNWFEHPNWALFELIARTVNRHFPEGSVLDVGCGRGDLLRYLRRRNQRLKLTGVDLSHVTPGSDFRFVQVDFQRWDAPDRFDVVTTLATIEHVSDVRKFVADLIARCNPGGLVVIMTLNDRSVLYSVARGLSRLGISRPAIQLYDRHHLNHFSSRSLRALIERSGLKVEQVRNHNAPLAAAQIGDGAALTKLVLRAGVWGVFTLGALSQRTYLQTIVARC